LTTGSPSVTITPSFWENDGSEKFTEHTIAGTIDGANSVYTADIDGDGDTDFLGTAYVADVFLSITNKI